MLDLGMLHTQAENLRRAIDASDDHFHQMLMKRHLSVVTATIAAVERQAERRPSRREQRRARKAAKNLVMYKTYGRRPWTDNNGVLYSSKAGVERMAQNGDDALSIAASYRSGPKLYRDDRRLHLREPCGFKAMSRLAEGGGER